MKKIILSVLLLLGLSVGVYAEKMQSGKNNQNDYIYVPECGYAIAQDSYCKKYIDIIKSKDEQIKALSDEIASLKAEQQMKLRKHLNKTYNKEMQEFDKQRSDTAARGTSSVIISDKPTP